MRLFRSRPPAEPLLLLPPRLDGTGWPPAADRASFDASAYAEMGNRRAYEPDAHALADRLLEAALPRLALDVPPEDEPYLRKTLLTAARIGTGTGFVDGEQTGSPAGVLDPGIAGALGLARRGLPAMRDDWARATTWVLLAGHYLARQQAAARDDALLDLLADLPSG